MIDSLYIKNYILVDELKVSFGNGLNIITGETGAGKSIIISAINQLCGERANAELVRKGAQKAILEMTLVSRLPAELKSKLNEAEIDYDDSGELILRKEIKDNGTGRMFVNDTPINLSTLNSFSQLFIDIHGQHQHQQLLFPENHLQYLDAIGRLHNDIEKFKTQFYQFKKLVNKIEGLQKERQLILEKQDLYRHQLSELEKEKLVAGEDVELARELKKLNNMETLHQLVSNLENALYSGDGDAADKIINAEKFLNSAAALDPEFNPFIANLQQARETVEEIGRFSQNYISNLQFDPNRFEQLNQRLARIDYLFKKYKVTSVDELLQLKERMENNLAGFENFESNIDHLKQELDAHIQETNKTAAYLHKKREETARKIEPLIHKEFNEIGLSQAQFVMKNELITEPDSKFYYEEKPVRISEIGIDNITFQIKPNQGEDPKPIHKIASGGELSRIMLALKTISANNDKTETLVFDEIDTGISGTVAQIVGRKMRQLSQYSQMICITHLPQIAAFSQNHYKVIKMIRDSRTVVDIIKLSEENKISEVASLLGGESLSNEALENAKHLINTAQK
jgi:DNA repair protein RecN (Recombination protein N)